MNPTTGDFKTQLRTITERNTWPILLMLAGGLLAALSLRGDLIGLNFNPGMAANLLWSGIGLFIIGVALDFVIGTRHLLSGITSLIDSLQDTIKLLTLIAQIVLVIMVLRHFGLENQALHHNIMLLTLFGFVINHFLPLRFRLGFFLLLTIAGMFGILGFINSMWMLGIGTLLIAICHLPIAFGVRIVLHLLVAAFLVTLRIGIVETPWSGIILPILASMFMFRLIIYMYDLRHQKEPVNFIQTFSYFFLLPNLVFQLFPVIDYKNFCRNYFDDDRFRIYQKGIYWLFHGTIHLILYRLVNNYLIITATEISSITDLAQYAVSNFMLLMRVSGQFHIAIGILHLFGFNLPRVMHRFFLAPSFTEFWRRANVYWKDFMQKVVFYPVYFQLRKLKGLSPVAMLAIPIFLATAFTWFFHAYQWFWIRGSFLLSGPDMTFWGAFGLLVVGNSIYEQKFGRKRSFKKEDWNFKGLVLRTLRTFGIFSVVSILWTLWISASFQEWLTVWSAPEYSPKDWADFFLAVLFVLPVFMLAVIVFEKINWDFLQYPETEVSSAPRPYFRAVSVMACALIAVYLIGQPAVSQSLGERGATVISDLRSNKLNFRDAALLEKGYYENLNNVNQFNTQLWELYMNKPKEWLVISQTDATRLRDDFMGMEFVPSTEIMFHGAKMTINRWGMRDKDYEKTPPPGTIRIALLGGSGSMGSGVEDQETFEWVLEDMLNEADNTSQKYEILNFSVGGYGPVRRYMSLKDNALEFYPQVAIFVAHPRDYYHTMQLLVRMARLGVESPFEFLRDISAKAGLDRKTTDTEGAQNLSQYEDEVTLWVYNRVVELCREREIVPLWFLMPSGVGMYEPEDYKKFVEFAQTAGFITFDITDVFDANSTDELRVAPWDWHPNAEGHRLIAERMYDFLQKKQPFPVPSYSSNSDSQTFGQD